MSHDGESELSQALACGALSFCAGFAILNCVAYHVRSKPTHTHTWSIALISEPPLSYFCVWRRKQTPALTKACVFGVEAWVCSHCVCVCVCVPLYNNLCAFLPQCLPLAPLSLEWVSICFSLHSTKHFSTLHPYTSRDFEKMRDFWPPLWWEAFQGD